MVERRLDYTALRPLREENGASLYLTSLAYAQQLWLDRLPARSILALDRAFFCALPSGHPVLEKHPMPYAALAWICRHHQEGTFLGNPRVSFQHIADRVQGRDDASPRKSIRAWACWAVVCHARPDFPGDPEHAVTPPTWEEIARHLAQLGGAAEVAAWRSALV